MVNGPAKFRRLLDEGRLLVLPGVYNALLARVMEEVGFPCLYMSGFSVATSMLGRPDLGMLGLTEMAQQAKHIAAAIDVPLLADADTGYGGLFSIKRTVEEYEMAGLAGLHIEDQDLLVKRCGWLGDVQIVEPDVMLQRLSGALQARRNDDFFIVARTDARRSMGFDEALRRAKIYAGAGADAVFVEYLTDIDEIRRVVDAVKIPVVTVVIDGPEMICARELESAGVQIALFPISILLATLGVARRVGEELRDKGHTNTVTDQMASSDNLMKYIHYEEMCRWESKIQVATVEDGSN
jgi:2-methylisocitrate lyase-like PEP mutase family enzyme